MIDIYPYNVDFSLTYCIFNTIKKTREYLIHLTENRPYVFVPCKSIQFLFRLDEFVRQVMNALTILSYFLGQVFLESCSQCILFC